MRYKLGIDGYISAVSFGCYLDNCAEYTGEIPAGYNSMPEWAEYACIQAYYIDADGNLVLDSERLAELKQKEAQEAIDYAPLLRKDLYGSDEVLNSQYIKKTETGEVLVLEGIKTLSPYVKITGFDPYPHRKLSIYTQGKQMMPISAESQKIAGVTFTKHPNGSINVNGMSTSDIEYTISGSSDNDTPLFALKKNHEYYLNLGGFDCELKYFDGETTAQQYVGASGLLNLPESIEVTEVILKIPSGKSANVTFYPQLEYGNAFTSYATHKSKVLHIDLSEQYPKALYPSETLYASDTLYVDVPTEILNYIKIQNGVIYASVNGIEKIVGAGTLGLYGSYNTIYALKDSTLEIEYSTNLIDVESLEFLQGKATTTNQFKILSDGSIEAHNGYFSGKIEADSGYFKGSITGGTININNRFKVDAQGNVTLPDNASISWGQISGTEDVAYTNQIPTDTNQLNNSAGYTTLDTVQGLGYQTAPQVTQITKDTVTTTYVNALNITAASVAAENITGTTISGKTLKGVTGDFTGTITAESGKIGGFTIGSNSIYSQKSSLYSSASGVYIGTDGIAVGYGSTTGSATFAVTSNGKIMLGYNSEIQCKGNIVFDSTCVLKYGSAGTNHIRFSSDGIVVGGYGGKLGFFSASNAGSTKKTVSNISSTTSATASTVASKLNDLLTALRAYNLIG